MATATADKQPIYVHCGKCSHEWAVGFFPIKAADFGKMQKLSCPLCRSRSVQMGIAVKESKTAEEWIGNGDTGTSSMTIWAVMMRRTSPHGRFDAPHDPADFGRCYRLLQLMPAWRARLPEVGQHCQVFRPMIACWDELTALYEEELKNKDGTAPRLYKRIQDLRAGK